MVFPTVSYSAKLNAKFSARGSSKKLRPSHPRVGPRHAPNIYDRIAAYDRAFQRCIQMDSKLSSWKKRMDEKGLPQPLIDGYERSPSSWQHSLSSLSSQFSDASSTYDSYTIRSRHYYDVKPTKSITITTTTTTSLPPPTPKPSVSRRIMNRLSLSKSKSTVTNNHSNGISHYSPPPTPDYYPQHHHHTFGRHHLSKIVPAPTQSARRKSIIGTGHYDHYQYPPAVSPVVIAPTPSPPPSPPSIPRTTYHHQLHHLMSQDRHSDDSPEIVKSSLSRPPSQKLQRHTSTRNPHHHHHQHHQHQQQQQYRHSYHPDRMTSMSTKSATLMPPPCGIEEYFLQKRYNVQQRQQRQYQQPSYYPSHKTPPNCA